MIFGPAYKGIPLATALSVAWLQLYGESKDVSYNRKEAKDHGEGGQLVGAAIRGRRVLIVDDVITAGTAVREALDLLRGAQALPVGVAVCLDRQERASDASPLSAIQVTVMRAGCRQSGTDCVVSCHMSQQVERELGLPVVSIVTLAHLVSHVRAQAGHADLALIEAYRQTYGVDY